MKIRKTSGLMASIVLAIFVSAPLIAQQDNQAMVDLVIQVQQLQDEVRMLTGKVEDQATELENLSDQQKARYLDLDQRINELRSASSGPMISGSATRTGRTAVTTSAAASGRQSPAVQVDDAPEIRAPVDTPSSTIALATPDTQARELAASPEAEKDSYDRAFQALKEQKYADSARLFQEFVERYPNSEYADNAQYWLGESYYVTRNYDIALEAYQGVLQNYPDSSKVAGVLLKIGYTHYELKNWDQARAALEQVEQQYANTTEARLARSRLNTMKREGHY